MHMNNSASSVEKKKVFAPWVRLPIWITLAGIGPVMFSGLFCHSALGAATGIILYLVGLTYFLVQTTGRFILKQRSAAWRALGCLFLCLIPGSLLLLCLYGLATSLNFDHADGFAKNLTIPTDIVVTTPLPRPNDSQNPEDHLQMSLLEAWRATPTNDPSVIPALPSLRVLASEHLPLLRQYLVFSPAWRVSENDGKLRATRRLKLGQMWRVNDGEDLSRSMSFRWRTGNKSFHFFTTISLDSPPRDITEGYPTRLDEGTSPKPVQLKDRTLPFPHLHEGTSSTKPMANERRKLFGSHIVIHCGHVDISFHEESAGQERQLTKAALRALETEFRAILDRKDFDRSLLPADSIHRGKPTLNLHDNRSSFLTGNYQAEVWINPGEPGLVYLKAFEVTQGTPLSPPPLREWSSERIGWSDNPNELFYGHSVIRIWEGDWGDFYAARFEVWFVPDSGQPERKLTDRVFKIEGWQF